jgi:predicted HicB family RNase H-like nuclease
MTDKDVDFWMESCRRREEGWFENLAEYSPETVLYLRIPELLKARLTSGAKRNGLSLNTWLTEQLAQIAEHEQDRATNEASPRGPTPREPPS